MTTYMYEIHSRMAYRLVYSSWKRSMVTPNFFSRIILLRQKAYNEQNIKKFCNAIFLENTKKCHILR